MHNRNGILWNESKIYYSIKQYIKFPRYPDRNID